MSNRVIVALDNMDFPRALQFVSLLNKEVHAFKVGLGKLTTWGVNGVLEAFRDIEDVSFFVDAKLTDIPNTLKEAVSTLLTLSNYHKIRYINVMANSGKSSMEAVVTALKDTPIEVLAVTVLTTVSRDECLRLYRRGPDKQVLELAYMAYEAGCDGLISSPLESRIIRRHNIFDMMSVITPGVRPANAALHDQNRVTKPGKAITNGSDYLVIGRPITDAGDPLAATIAINREINKALERKEAKRRRTD